MLDSSSPHYRPINATLFRGERGPKWRDAHVLMNIEQKCTYLRVLLTGFVHDWRSHPNGEGSN
jgi:hypothetical protein